MARSFADRGGFLLVRLWIEGEIHDPSFRARLTYRPDAAVSDSEVASAATVDQVCEVVRAWVAGFLRGGPQDSGIRHRPR
jgi:hypothetical protein